MTKQQIIHRIREYYETNLVKPEKGVFKTRKREQFIEICVMKHTVIEAAKRVYASELDPYVILEDYMWDMEAYMYKAHKDKSFMFDAAFMVLEDMLSYLYSIDPEWSEFI